MKLFCILCFLLFLQANCTFSQSEVHEDSTDFLLESKELIYRPTVYLRFGSFHGFGSPVVFNQVPFTKGVGISLENKRFLFALEMDFFKFKNEIDSRIEKDRCYHIKAAMNFKILESPKHTLILGASFGRLESFYAHYSAEEYNPEFIYNSQRYWVLSPQLSYFNLVQLHLNSKWAFKFGAYASYSIPLQGYVPYYKLEKLPSRELWYMDGALQVGVTIGITQLRNR